MTQQRNKKKKRTSHCYLILKQIVPGLATQRVTDNDFEEVERYVKEDAVTPYDSGPSPSNPLNPCEAPVRVHRDQCSSLVTSTKFITTCLRQYILMSCVVKELVFLLLLTSCAKRKAATRRRPGRSKYDKLRERVTKIRAWLTMLTCRYTAAVSSCSLFLIDRTPNLSCNYHLLDILTC